MSKSVRLSDELTEKAKRAAKIWHRTPPQQIEHWAHLGMVMESALGDKTKERVLEWGSRKDVDELLAFVETPAGKERAKEVIRQTSGTLYTVNPDNPEDVQKVAETP